MAINQESFNTGLYDLLKTRGYNPTPIDSKGQNTPVPQDADIFKFDFKKGPNTSEDYGPVWVTIDKAANLIVYFDDDVADSGDTNTSGTEFSDSWPSLLKVLKRWAMRKQLGFELKNRDHLGSDMAQREYAKKKEALGESYHPISKRASYNDAVPQVKIIIQHSRQIEEGEKRFRNVERIFVENSNGERFAIPTKRPGIAKVYARHVAEGGTPYDDKGKHITSLVEEYTKMAGFVRATRNATFNESAQQLINEGLNHYQSLRETLGRMIGYKGYNAYFESWTPTLMETEGDEMNLNELFVKETLDPRIESVMPILKRLSKNIGEMKEVSELSEWANNITEEESLKSNNPIGIPEGESKERPYICVHVKKGKCEVKANSSYEAAQKAAQKWGLKSTSGIDAHLADVTHDSASLEEGIPEDEVITLPSAKELYKEYLHSMDFEKDSVRKTNPEWESYFISGALNFLRKKGIPLNTRTRLAKDMLAVFDPSAAKKLPFKENFINMAPQAVAEGSKNLSYIGNCTDDDVIEHIFGDATNFAQAVEEHGDEFTIDDLVVKYDPESDIHSFYYKKQGVAEARDGDTNFGHTVTRGSWVVHDGNKVKRFNTHNGAKAYAEKNGGKVASSEFYADKIQGKQGVAEESNDHEEMYGINLEPFIDYVKHKSGKLGADKAMDNVKYSLEVNHNKHGEALNKILNAVKMALTSSALGEADESHTGEENGMASDNLNKMAKASTKINKKVKGMGNKGSLEPWQQQLVATAADKVDAVYHSLDDEELDEGWNDRLPDGISPEQYIDSMYDRADRDRKEKKEKELLDKEEPPFTGGHAVTTHKDKFGNVIKHVAKHLARKAMKDQETKTSKNEEVEQVDESKIKDSINKHPAVEYYGGKDDHHMIDLKPGYIHSELEQHSFSNRNASDAKKELKSVKKCDCDNCKKAYGTGVVSPKQVTAPKSRYYRSIDELDESKWRYGCGKKMSAFVPKGYGYKEIPVECGSTAYDGSVNQCEKCEITKAQPRVHDYGDVEHMDDDDIEEGLDANQKRAGQLGPTTPVGKNEKNLRNKGLFFGAESVDPELARIKKLSGN